MGRGDHVVAVLSGCCGYGQTRGFIEAVEVVVEGAQEIQKLFAAGAASVQSGFSEFEENERPGRAENAGGRFEQSELLAFDIDFKDVYARPALALGDIVETARRDLRCFDLPDSRSDSAERVLAGMFSLGDGQGAEAVLAR